MRGELRSAALVAGVMLFAAACDLGGGTTSSTSPETSPSTAQTSPVGSSPISSPTGGTTSTPSSTPSSSPAGAALAVNSLPFHNGEVGVGYLAVTLGAAGGTPPYTWSTSGGTFPPGLNLSSGGAVTGNNSTAGQFGFTVQVADAAGGTATAPASIHVYPPLQVSQPCASQCLVEEGCTICGNFGSVSGGLPPYHYTILSDNRPTGMGVNVLTLTGAFPAPGPLGAYSLSVQVKDDQFGATQTVNANWTVFSHIAITQTSWSCGNSASSCSLAIAYTGGTPGGKPTVRVVSVGPVQFFTGPPPPPTMSVPGIPVTGGPPSCNSPNTVTPTGLPPGTTSPSGGGVVTLNIGPRDFVNYCGYQARVTIVFVDQSPCGPGNCFSNAATIDISI